MLMQFGTPAYLEIRLAPLFPSWKRVSLADRGPWAAFSLTVDHQCLTLVSEDESDSLKRAINVPLLPLGDWLVRNIKAIAYEESPKYYASEKRLHALLEDWKKSAPQWGLEDERWEDARYSWFRRHFWLSDAEGALLPDLAFVRSDNMLWTSVNDTVYDSFGRSMRYFNDSRKWIAVEWGRSFEALSDFVSYIAAESRALGLDSPAWVKQEHPLREAVRCSAAEFADFVAPESPGLLNELSIPSDIVPEQSMSLMCMRDLVIDKHTLPVLRNAFNELETAVREHRNGEWSRSIRESFAGSGCEAGNYMIGYEAARRLRNELKNPSKPVQNDELNELAARCADIREVDGVDTDNYSIFGANRDHGAGGVLFQNRKTRKPWVRRMELAKLICHALLDPYSETGILAAGASIVACSPRAQRANAFAAEFLVPSKGIASYFDETRADPADIEVLRELMETYHVGATTLLNQLHNHGYVRRQQVDELLEEIACPAD